MANSNEVGSSKTQMLSNKILRFRAKSQMLSAIYQSPIDILRKKGILRNIIIFLCKVKEELMTCNSSSTSCCSRKCASIFYLIGD